MTDGTGTFGGCLRLGAALAILGSLSACHSTPAVERPPKNGPAVQGPEVPPQAAHDRPVQQHIQMPVATPIETPIVAPPCLPAETAPQLKHVPKPKPEPPPAVPSSAAPTAAAGGIDAEVRPLDTPVDSVLGKKVQGAKGEDLGRVVDVLADADGRVRAAIIEFGGFLGVGNRRIAVDWSLLRFHPEALGSALTLSVSVKALQSVPEYKNTARPRALMAPRPPATAQPAAAAPEPSAAEGKK